MKNFIKSSLIFFLIIFVFSCSKDEKAIDVPKETISLEDGLDFNFDDLTAVTLEGEADVDVDGGFQADVSTTLSEELPILFTKDDEVMFGYYSKTGASNTISGDDILLFFFTGHPELSTLAIEYRTLMVKIKESSNYTELKDILRTSLESNTSPLKNTSFMTLLNTVANQIIKDKRGYKVTNNKASIDTYEINFTEDGKMTWEKEFPLFATVGLEIINLDGTENEQYLLKSSPLVASPNAGFWWVYNLLKDNIIDNTTDSYQFSAKGRYKIFISNGVDFVGTNSFEQKIDFENRFLLGANLVSLAFPISLKKWVKSDCKQELSSLFFNLAKTAILAAAVDDFQLEKFVKEQHDDIYKVVKKCVLEANWTYYDRLIKFFDSFNKTQTASELGYLIRDYVFSNISGEETRYYYNSISYGQLTLTNFSGDNNGVPTSKTEFTGEIDSEHTFKAFISEEKYKYELESDFNRLLPSEMTQQKKDAPRQNFPFIAEKLSGNAEQTNVNSSPAITNTNSEGKLEMTFKMGTQNSQFEIKPAFEGKGLPDVETINLKNESFIYEGDWYLLSYTPWVNYCSNPSNPCEEAKFTFDANGESTKVERSSTAHNGGVTIYEEAPDHYTATMSYNDSNNTLSLTYNYSGHTYYFPAYSTNDNIFYTTSAGFIVELHRL